MGVSGEAERVRAAAGVLAGAADEVPALFHGVAQRFDAAVWSGASARLAEERVRDLRERLQQAAAELEGVAFALHLRAARLAEDEERRRTEALLGHGDVLDDSALRVPPGW